MEDKIAADLKTAMLAKDTLRVSVLRSLKSAFTYAKVAPNSTSAANEDGSLSDDAVLALIAKEAKKRQESADSFMKASQQARADEELAEKAIIEAYLPAQVSDDELKTIIEDEVAKLDEISTKAMGQVIGAVKAKTGPTADGGKIAQLVKAKLSAGYTGSGQ